MKHFKINCEQEILKKSECLAQSWNFTFKQQDYSITGILFIYHSV